MKQNKITPKLRFPRFENREDWREIKIGDICTILRGSSFSKGEIIEDGMYSCIHYGELFTKYKEVITNVISRTNTSNGTFSEVGDVLMPTSDVTPNGLARASTLNLKGILLGGDMNILRLKENTNINSIYLSYFLNYNKRNILKLVTGSIIKHIYASDIETLPFQSASKEEQQKIADCLSSLDEVISQHEEKLLNLEEHKRGLMQNLFPQEGETKPKYRFPEFENEGDWEEKKLEELARYENGKAHEQDILEDGEYLVVNAKFIATNGQVKKYSDIATCLANKKDILMVLSDLPNGRALGKCFYVDEENRYTVNQRICKLSSKIINPFLLYYLLDRNAYFLSFNDGVKQTNLKKDDVLNCPVVFPKKEEEQQKIADCLSSVDNLISETSERIEELKQHKQGLMQGLFPHIKG